MLFVASNHMKGLFLLLAVLAGMQQLHAQDTDRVTIHKDPRLDLLIQKQVELNKEAYKENNRTGPGYRVLVINTNDRRKALEVKSRIMTDFPEHKTYLIYQSPYFKIQAGNFRDRKEAENLRKQILRIYPTGVIVVPSTVEYKADASDGTGG
jgi:hypothetical protein